MQLRQQLGRHIMLDAYYAGVVVLAHLAVAGSPFMAPYVLPYVLRMFQFLYHVLTPLHQLGVMQDVLLPVLSFLQRPALFSFTVAQILNTSPHDILILWHELYHTILTISSIITCESLRGARWVANGFTNSAHAGKTWSPHELVLSTTDSLRRCNHYCNPYIGHGFRNQRRLEWFLHMEKNPAEREVLKG